MPECIDLERMYGQRFAVGYEDASFAATADPWHKVLKCKHGHICPAGGDKLWACTNSNRGAAASRLRKGDLPCTVKMDGDDGVNAEFHIQDYDLFFKLMGAKRR